MEEAVGVEPPVRGHSARNAEPTGALRSRGSRGDVLAAQAQTLALGDHSADLDAVSDDLDAVSDDELADRLIARRPDLFDGTERKALIDAFAKLRIGDGAAEVRESPLSPLP